MDSFFVSAGAASFVGLVMAFAVAIIAPIAGWNRHCVTRSLAIVLAVAVAQGLRAQWDISAIYSYAAAGALGGLLWAIADISNKMRATSADA